MITSPKVVTDSEDINLNNYPSKFRIETLDYIPMVSMVSGVARAFFGLMQTVAATGKNTVSLLDFCLHPSRGSSIDDGTSLYLKGKFNFLRGSVAICPIFGNITLYFYDKSNIAKNWERSMAGIVAVGL